MLKNRLLHNIYLFSVHGTIYLSPLLLVVECCFPLNSIDFSNFVNGDPLLPNFQVKHEIGNSVSRRERK